MKLFREQTEYCKAAGIEFSLCGWIIRIGVILWPQCTLIYLAPHEKAARTWHCAPRSWQFRIWRFAVAGRPSK